MDDADVTRSKARQLLTRLGAFLNVGGHVGFCVSPRCTPNEGSSGRQYPICPMLCMSPKDGQTLTATQPGETDIRSRVRGLTHLRRDAGRPGREGVGAHPRRSPAATEWPPEKNNDEQAPARWPRLLTYAIPDPPRGERDASNLAPLCRATPTPTTAHARKGVPGGARWSPAASRS